VPVIAKLFNKIFEVGQFPEIWNRGIICPIYKKGDPYKCDNYRGICLTSCLGKVFNSILASHILKYNEENHIISNHYAGIWPSFRTTEQMQVPNTLINKYIRSKKKKIYASFIDFRKAFDTVDRNILLSRLAEKGIDGKLFKLCSLFTRSTTYKIKTGDGYTDEILGSIGIKQGDNLSPLLFNIFIDKVCTCFPPDCDPVKLREFVFSCLLFADDLLLLSESEKGLQKCLDHLATFCDVSKLQVNLDKS
jgi:hypothetical protein